MNPDKYGDHEPKKRDKAGRDGKRQRKKSYKRSKQQEERVADKLGGKRVSGSGAGRVQTGASSSGIKAGGARAGVEEKSNKGDVTSKALLTEAKSTSNLSMSVKMAWLEKIYAEAVSEDKTPGLAISFERRSEWPGFPQDWVAVPAEWLYEQLQRLDLADPA